MIASVHDKSSPLNGSGSMLAQCSASASAAHRERRLLLPISLFKFAYFLLDTGKFVSPCLRKRLVFLPPRLKLVHQLEQFGPALTLHALTDQQPLALPLAESEGFCRSKLRRLLVRRLDNSRDTRPGS
jgi:hypothetical protein